MLFIRLKNQTMSAMTGKIDYQPFQHPPDQTSFCRCFHQPGQKVHLESMATIATAFGLPSFWSFLGQGTTKRPRLNNFGPAAMRQLWHSFFGEGYAWNFPAGWCLCEVLPGEIHKMGNPPPKINEYPLKNAGWKTIGKKDQVWRAGDLVLNLSPPNPGFTNMLVQFGTICGGFVSEHVFWWQICKP